MSAHMLFLSTHGAVRNIRTSTHLTRYSRGLPLVSHGPGNRKLSSIRHPRPRRHLAPLTTRIAQYARLHHVTPADVKSRQTMWIGVPNITGAIFDSMIECINTRDLRGVQWLIRAFGESFATEQLVEHATLIGAQEVSGWILLNTPHSERALEIHQRAFGPLPGRASRCAIT